MIKYVFPLIIIIDKYTDRHKKRLTLRLTLNFWYHVVLVGAI
jgi:hypothetical protein